MHPVVMPYIDCVDMTRAAVEDVVAQTLPTALLLLDNGSQPEGRALAEELRVAHPQHVLPWHHDPPFPALAAVWNRALRWAWEAGADQALVVNNDVRLAPWTYALLREVQQRTNALVVTAVGVTPPQFETYLAQGPESAVTALGVPTESRKDGIRPEGYSYGGPDFSCFLMTKECHDAFQFDEGFVPAYFEDLDLHRRMLLGGAGQRIFGVNLPFLHYGSATINRTEDIKRAWPPRFAACREYYARKWGGDGNVETFTRPFDEASAQADVMTPLLQQRVANGRPAVPDTIVTKGQHTCVDTLLP